MNDKWKQTNKSLQLSHCEDSRYFKHVDLETFSIEQKKIVNISYTKSKKSELHLLASSRFQPIHPCQKVINHINLGSHADTGIVHHGTTGTKNPFALVKKNNGSRELGNFCQDLIEQNLRKCWRIVCFGSDTTPPSHRKNTHPKKQNHHSLLQSNPRTAKPLKRHKLWWNNLSSTKKKHQKIHPKSQEKIHGSHIPSKRNPRLPTFCHDLQI